MSDRTGGVPINGTGRLLEIVRCRVCGAQGMEDPAIDPAPGLCPACFEQELASGDFWVVGMREDEPPLDQVKRRANDPMLPGLEGL